MQPRHGELPLSRMTDRCCLGNLRRLGRKYDVDGVCWDDGRTPR